MKSKLRATLCYSVVKTATRMVLGCSALLLASCDDHASATIPQLPNDNLIELSSDFATASAQTRGEGSINSTLTADLSVRFVRLDRAADGGFPDDYSGVSPLPATIDKDDGTVTFDTQQFYTLGEVTRFIGWYPNTGTWSDEDGTASYTTIDGTTDIMVATAADGSLDNKFSDSSNTVTFTHVLSRVRLKVSVEDAAHADRWGELTSATLLNKAQTCTLTLPATTADVGTAPTAMFGTSTGALAFSKNDNSGAVADVELSEEPVVVGYTMMAPHTANTDKLTLRVTTGNGGEQDIDIPYDDLELEAGYSYDLHLEFRAVEIILAGVTITPWNDGGSTDKPIGEPLPDGWDDLIDWDSPIVNDGESNSYIVPPGGQLLIPISRAQTYFETDEGQAAIDENTGFAPLAAGEQFYAKLYWSDTAGLLTESDIYPIGIGPKGYLLVKPGNISGNALVAVQKKTGEGETEADYTTLWSWHVWVTDYNPNASGATFTNIWNTNNNGSHFVFMDRNLGATFAGIGNLANSDNYGTGLFYQWGRKDPFPATLAANDPQPGFGSFTFAVIADANATVATAIQNPHVFINTARSSYYWLNVFISNLWRPDEKTIYDPCPAGWRLPITAGATPGVNAFNGLTYLSAEWNNGACWDTNAVFPAAGYRLNSSLIQQQGGLSGVYIGAQNELIYRWTYWQFAKSVGVSGSVTNSEAYGARCVREPR